MPRSFARQARRDLKCPLFWLGCALPVCFVAGVTGATIPTQMPLLSIALVPVLWREGRAARAAWFGVAVLAYAALSLLWAINPVDSAFGLWQAALWALGFWLGVTTATLAPLWRGLAIGLAVSSFVAVAQALGWDGIPVLDHPAGLLYSGSVQGGMIALVTLALIYDSSWLYIPAMLPGLYLAHSRGGWLILCVGMLARVHWALAAGAVATAGAWSLVFHGDSDTIRLMDWSIAAHALRLFGGGIGSFIDVLYQVPPNPVIHPSQVHNDYLQLAFELGIGAIPAYVLLAAALIRVDVRYWTVMVGFCTFCLFYFPLYCASLAFIGTAVAGHILRRDDRAWFAGYHSGLDFVAWLSESRRENAAAWRQTVPAQSGIEAAKTGALDAAF